MEFKVHHTDVNLYQLVDSSFPVGGFVYSLGMESAVKYGAIKTNEDVVRYLVTYLDQLISFEFPFIDAGYTFINSDQEWGKIAYCYEAMLMNPNIQKGSVVLGKNWLKLICSLYSCEKAEAIYTCFKNKKLPFHYVVLFSLGCAALQIDQSEVREMYIYSAMRDQISALTRLGAIGSHGGQSLLTKMLNEGKKRISNYLPKHYTEATKSAYLLDIIQLNHSNIYSKLFQN